MEDKFYKFLGLVIRAGKIAIGTEQTIIAMRRGKAVLVIVAGDASNATVKKVTDKCNTYNVDCIRIGTKVKLGNSIGKDERTVLGITGKSFKAKLLELAESIKNGGNL
jgi:ribosomal protein L7Ae-like RNA K-turn-binding protein